MKLLAAFALLLVAGLSVQAQQKAPKGMGAADLLDALASHDPAQRDHASLELKRMDVKTAEDLGRKIQDAGVREAETALVAVGLADCAHAAVTACVALDAKEKTVRIAAMDALITISPIKVSEGGAKHLTAKRLEIIRKLVDDSDYVKQLCESVTEDDKGGLVPPVEKLLRLTILLDRFFGIKGMPMMLGRISGYMLGDEPNAEKEKTPTQRSTDERLRREAEACFKAIWISDPAIQFNYSATAPWKKRRKAVERMLAVTEKLQKLEVELPGSDKKFTGQRYGDHLRELFSSDIGEVQAAAYLRFQWWMGEDVSVSGEGYAKAVDKVNSLDNHQRRRLRRVIDKWWKNYRGKTELK
jgi:hypothetical protein